MARTPGARNGVSVMLMPMRTLVVFAASQGISGHPWYHWPREETGRALGNSVHHAERVLEFRSIGGFRDDDPVERPDGVEVEVLGQAGELFELLDRHLVAEVRQVESELHADSLLVVRSLPATADAPVERHIPPGPADWA